MADVLALFDEYAAAFARGEEPDLRAYLALAGDGAAELARLVDGFVSRAEPAEPSAERVALARAWVEGSSPLLELRVGRGLRRDEVVDALVRRLGLDPRQIKKVMNYYHELESGLLAPGGVDRRVWDALAETLRTTVETLRGWRPRPLPATGGAFLRAAAAAPAPQAAPARKAAAAESPRTAPEDGPDEVDRLFRYGS